MQSLFKASQTRQISRNTLTRVPHVPCITLHLYELDTEKVLVNVKNSRDDDRNGEVLFDERVVKAQILLDIETVVVPGRHVHRHQSMLQKVAGFDFLPVVPNIKVVIGWQISLRMDLLFECNKGLEFFLPKRVDVSFQGIQELYAKNAVD
jgi:hypothetical protein